MTPFQAWLLSLVGDLCQWAVIWFLMFQVGKLRQKVEGSKYDL